MWHLGENHYQPESSQHIPNFPWLQIMFVSGYSCRKVIPLEIEALISPAERLAAWLGTWSTAGPK